MATLSCCWPRPAAPAAATNINGAALLLAHHALEELLDPEDAELLRRVEASMPLGRIGQPEEVAEVIVWLLSDKASLVTGAHVNAGGGGFLEEGRFGGALAGWLLLPLTVAGLLLRRRRLAAR